MEQTYKKEQVVEIVKTLSSRVNAHHPLDQKLRQEVESLKGSIETLQSELGSGHSHKIQGEIPDATDELEAVVATTEEATNTIMESCEAIQNHIKEQSIEHSAPIDTQLIRIIEACTFQDLTGQRITKIVKALKDIDAQASQLSKIISEAFPDLPQGDRGGEENKKGDELLNGPSMPGEGISQEEIDKLLEDF